MTIALIAHDSKKELMVQFCTAYCRILSQNQLVATGTTGKLIAESTGLPVKRFLSASRAVTSRSRPASPATRSTCSSSSATRSMPNPASPTR